VKDAEGTGIEPPFAEVVACRAAHERLAERVETIDDVVMRRPSRLPDWTIGHVLTHVARNADSFVRVLEAAGEGRSVAQYPGGLAQRSGEIESGAQRSSAAIVNDLRSTSERLDKALADASPATWRGSWTAGKGMTFTCAELPWRRLREVEFHHVDLGLGYEIADWPDEFVDAALRDSLQHLPDRILDRAQRRAFLAWVAGRRESPGQVDLAPF
jgi:maleylpyruvate isomerase